MLFPIIGGTQKKFEFVICLTNKIMVEPFTEIDKQRKSEDRYNPLAQKSPSSLEKMHNGSRNISKKDASAILTHIDKEKFAEYLSVLSHDALELLGDRLRENGITVSENEVDIACAELFASILTDCANGKSSLPKNVVDSEEVKNKMSPKQIRDTFIKAVDYYKIMEIINRKPAVIYRADSTSLNVFRNQTNTLIIVPFQRNENTGIDKATYASIKNFYDRIRILSLSVEASLNNRFDFEDESAFINMEEEAPTEKKSKSNCAELPRLSREFIAENISESHDPLGLVELAIKQWGNFRDELNFLYNEIRGVDT